MRAWKEIKTWEKLAGWYIEPATETKYCYVGDDVQLGDDVWLGDYVRLGVGVCLGNGVRLGDRVCLGDGVCLGSYVRLGNDVCLGDRVCLGDYVRLGDYVWLPVYRSHKHSIHWHAPGTIRAGCIVEPFDWWRKNVRPVADKHGYPPDEQERYVFFVEQIIAWEKLMGDKIGWVRQDRTDG